MHLCCALARWVASPGAWYCMPQTIFRTQQRTSQAMNTPKPSVPRPSVTRYVDSCGIAGSALKLLSLWFRTLVFPPPQPAALCYILQRCAAAPDMSVLLLISVAQRADTKNKASGTSKFLVKHECKRCRYHDGHGISLLNNTL